MNLLNSDPFYHNIINHLSLKDIKCLKCLCKHLKFTFTKKHINQFTINSIKNDVYILFNTKEHKQELQLMITNNKNDNGNLNTKYFIVAVSRLPHKKLDNYSHLMTIVDRDANMCLIHNTYNHEFGYSCSPNDIISILASNDDNDIQNFKINKWNINKNDCNLYWLDNDDKKDVLSLLSL